MLCFHFAFVCRVYCIVCHMTLTLIENPTNSAARDFNWKRWTIVCHIRAYTSTQWCLRIGSNWIGVFVLSLRIVFCLIDNEQLFWSRFESFDCKVSIVFNRRVTTDPKINYQTHLIRFCFVRMNKCLIESRNANRLFPEQISMESIDWMWNIHEHKSMMKFNFKSTSFFVFICRAHATFGELIQWKLWVYDRYTNDLKARHNKHNRPIKNNRKNIEAYLSHRESILHWYIFPSQSAVNTESNTHTHTQHRIKSIHVEATWDDGGKQRNKTTHSYICSSIWRTRLEFYALPKYSVDVFAPIQYRNTTLTVPFS